MGKVMVVRVHGQLVAPPPYSNMRARPGLMVRCLALHPFQDVSGYGDFLGVTDRTVRNYIAQGRLKAHRVGPKLLRITADELSRFLEGT